MKTKQKCAIGAVLLVMIGCLVLIHLKRGPMFPPPPNSKDYYLKEWLIYYWWEHDSNETINFTLKEGMMEVTLSNLNSSEKYEVGEIRFTCVGAVWGDRFLDERITNVSTYIYEWEPHGGVNNQYGVGFNCWAHPIGWIYPYFEKLKN